MCSPELHMCTTRCTSKWLIATARTEYHKDIEVPIHTFHHAVEILLMLCLPGFTHNARLSSSRAGYVQAMYDIEAKILCSKRKSSMIQSLFLWSHLEVLIQITAVHSPSISCCTQAHVTDVLLLTGFCKKSKAYPTYVRKLRFVARIASAA
jgi:hypothetical protein